MSNFSALLMTEKKTQIGSGENVGFIGKGRSSYTTLSIYRSQLTDYHQYRFMSYYQT